MPMILKYNDDKFIIRDPFYAGEWILDREAVTLYLDFLKYLKGLCLDDGTRILKGSSELRLPEPFTSFITEGLPLRSDFSPDKVALIAEKVTQGIITPPVPIIEITPYCNYHCPWCFVPHEFKYPKI
jgi:hypothetical protein